MSFYLTSNVSSLNALRHFNQVGLDLSKSLERLSSGYKINRASDGPASLMVSETMRSQIRGFDVATSNAQQGLSMLNIADGALQQINEHLQSLREIAIGGLNATTTTAQYTAYSNQITAELAAIDQIAASTKYGSNVLLDGSISLAVDPFNIQIGPNSGDTLNIQSAFTSNVSGVAGLGITQNAITSAADADLLLTQVTSAFDNLHTNLSTIGGFQNRLTNQINYLSIAKENFTAAEAQIRNADVASETANLARLQIRQQAAAFALGQISSRSSIVLQLLQGF